MDESGANVRPIFPEGSIEGDEPSSSPDGTKLVYTDHGLWVANIDGTGRTRLVSDPSAKNPTWSPDGKKVYYSKFAGGDELIFCVDTDGKGAETQVSPPHPGAANALDRHPSVSPDGTKIAFTTSRQVGEYDGMGGVAIMNVDGSGLMLLPTGTWKDREGQRVYQPYPMVGGGTQPGVSWAPDGRRLAFSAYPAPGGKSQIYVMNSDGTGITQLTHEDTLNCYGPVWSPDGKKLVFWKEYPGFGGNEIYIMSSDGSSQRPLTDRTVMPSCYGPCFLKKPR